MVHKGVIIPGVYSRDEFQNVQTWEITEKVDGMNIRIEYDNTDCCYGSMLSFLGKTDKAEIPKALMKVLKDTFYHEDFEANFPEAKTVTLFGEGYGAKIQKGGALYRSDDDFILFDVNINGIWLRRKSVLEIGRYFHVPCVPLLGIMNERDAVYYVKMEYLSQIALQERSIEGIVARSSPLMLFRNGNPVMWKLKCQDYRHLGEVLK
jgi:hypothetical protein